MSITTFRTTDAFGPVLVSELPPLTAATATRPGLLAGLREALALRRQARLLNRAIDSAGRSERGDLIALSRRS
jgi:hypothetical protein